MDKLDLITSFPKLAGTSFEITSPKTTLYNCIAWAAGEMHRRWWPDKMKVSYWPDGVPKETTLAAFIAAYATVNFVPCENGDPENGFEKIVIYLKPAGTPAHAARLLPNGKWTSKLGNEEDIEHELHGVECPTYGQAKQFLKRAVAKPSNS